MLVSWIFRIVLNITYVYQSKFPPHDTVVTSDSSNSGHSENYKNKTTKEGSKTLRVKEWDKK